jgi:suppressor of G2 allele of SKP1
VLPIIAISPLWIVADVTQLEVNFPTVSGSDYDFTLSPLFSTIDTIRSTYNITPYKVEISLHKMTSGLKWSTLEGTLEEADTAQKSSSYMGKIGYPAPSICETAYNSAIRKAPAYPTSSRNGPKDWDALAKDALKKEKQASGADPATIDDDDIEGGDPVQGFFKKIYKDADPDTQRAMMKSFVESNGTALSTDWGDVGSKTVPISPPDGIEAKKWET